MLITNTMSARKLQKSYKSIIEEVKLKKRAVILTTKNKPQAAIVSLEDFATLQQKKAAQISLDLLQLAIQSKKELKSLPSDLRAQANKILYGK